MRTLYFSPLVIALALMSPGRVDAAPGDLEAGFNPNANSTVTCTAVQADGRIIIAGEFTTVGGVTRNRIARLHADGALDLGFDPNVNNHIHSVAVQTDGKIVLAGIFTAVGGVTRNRVARLNPSGTLDVDFNPNVSWTVNACVIQPDGKIIIAGDFGSVGGASSNYIARLNGNGTRDGSFVSPEPDGTLFRLALQADGKLLIAGQINTVGGVSRYGLARLNANGSVDASFTRDVGWGVVTMALQPDGKILIGGQFSLSSPNMARLHADGAEDTSFYAGAEYGIFTLAVQADGKIVIGGDFGAVGGYLRSHVARLNADGSLDLVFDPNNPNIDSNPVNAAAVQADGKILLGGSFTSMASVARNRIARVENYAAVQSLTASGASRVQWLRSGASPEVEQVTFELSTDGGNVWAPLGAGARIAGGWERTGLSLPGSGQLRARARTIGGTRSASSGIVETVAAFASPDTDGDGLLDSWELTYWPTIVGHAAGDDFDRDGLSELLELAFGLNPTNPDIAAQPAVIDDGGYLTITLTKHTGVTYEVQSAATPDAPAFSAATTTVLVNTATTLKVSDNILIGTPPARYLRVKVTAAP